LFVVVLKQKLKPSTKGILLILKSLCLILSNLNENGSLIINMTMKNIYLTFNLINMLGKYFGSYKLWKSSKVWETKNTFYFFGYNFKNNLNIEDISSLKDDKNEIYSKFLGSQEEYNKINYEMKRIYQVRINSLRR
jgi:hypothetical protein